MDRKKRIFYLGLVLLIVVVICAVGVMSIPMFDIPKEDVIVLPAGYQVLCSIPEGKFTLKFPDGVISANVWDNEGGAKAFAVHWENIKGKPRVYESSLYSWEECKPNSSK